MAAIEAAHEQQVGQRRRRVAQLPETVHAQAGDPGHVRWVQSRPFGHVHEQLDGPFPMTRQREHREHGRVVADVGVELAADAGQRLVQRLHRQRRRAFVEEVRREGGQSRRLVAVARRAGMPQPEQAHQRQFPALRGDQAEARGQFAASQRGEANAWWRVWYRQAASIDAHATTACRVSVRPRCACCPVGTTPRARNGRDSHDAAACCRSAGVARRYRARSSRANPGSSRYTL